MNIVRRYKLSLLKYDFLTEKEIEDLNIIFKEIKYCKENFDLINFIYNNMLNLKLVELKEYPDYIMYFNHKGENIFQHNLKTNIFYVNYKLIWVVFKVYYNYQGIRDLVKGIIKQAYKIQIQR